MESSHQPRICISICEPTIAALELAIAAEAETSNLIEVRLDCLDDLELKAGKFLIAKLLEETDRDSILTFRPAEQGGRRELDYATRYVFWALKNFPDSESFLDVELDLAESLNSSSYVPMPVDWSRLICSHHDFVGAPDDLAHIYERMAKTPARILKIAVQVDDAIDCLPVFRLLERAGRERREMIAIAMGSAGIATRILGPARGAFLTYASPENGIATAPGQMTVRELREIYRVDKLDRQTQIFGLVGRPVSHSVSPIMHNAAFAAMDANAVYIPFEVKDVNAFIKRMIHPRTRELSWNLRGLSVTAPHKSTVMGQLDWIEPAAREIGAVNTIVIAGEDSLHGYNTDARAFVKPLQQVLGDLTSARCAIVGAGGAASAAIWSLREVGANTTVCARVALKARELAGKFDVDWKVLADSSFDGFDVVVNATPLGTAGPFEDEAPVHSEQLRGARLAYDLVYNPTDTRFLREARAAGCETLGGLPMLVAQASDQLRLWTGEPAPEEVMYEAAQKALIVRRR